MNDILVKLLGPDNAIYGEFAVTAVALVVVLALAVWLVRRVARIRVGGGSRSKVARLAIVDAMAIDNKRRLILVRRDAVEHLILIGGPSDLLVEPSIMRARQRPVQAVTGQGAPASVATIDSASAAAPIPVAAARPAAAAALASVAGALLATPVQSPAAALSAPLVEPAPMPPPFGRMSSTKPAPTAASAAARNTASETSFTQPSRAPDWHAPKPTSIPVLDAGPDGSGAAKRIITPPDDAIVSPGSAWSGLLSGAHLDSDGVRAAQPVSSQNRSGSSPADSAAHKVSELEAEMNRLLGQLSADRRSI